MDALSRWLRSVCSLAPLLGVVATPENRPNGVSAMVRVRGEEEWLEPCLLSIREFADEILVLDNGASSQAQAALDRLRDSLGEILRLERCPDLDLFQLSNLGLAKARFRWVIRWDADFVAHTSGAGDIRSLRRSLLELDRRRYYLMYLPAVEVAGDLFHQFPDRRVRFDGQVHVAAEGARYVPVRRSLPPSAVASPDRVLRPGPTLRVTLESLRVPKFYQVLRWPQVTYFHVNVKSARRSLLGHFWLEWLGQGDFARFPTVEAYAQAEVRARWDLTDLDAAARHFMARYCAGLVAFDADRCGSYPDLLRPFLDRPQYRVEYRDGQVVGRREGA
jgi:glycosyltransferase involved in cell wall biosynthesis